MRTSHLVFLLALLAAPPLPAAESDPVTAGPMVGRATHHDVVVWLRTRDAGASVRIGYWLVGQPEKMQKTSSRKSGGGDGHLLHISLTELVPGSTYVYAVFVEGRRAAFSYPLRFQTQPLWQGRSAPPEFTVAAGSCVYINDREYEPSKKGYGGEYHIFESIRAQQPDLMLWLGDNIYLRPTDWGSRAGIYRRYARDRALPALQPLLASTHNYAIWDDHDFGPNNSDRSYVLKGHALEAFRDMWANPSYGLPDVPGVFGQFTWGDIDFFLLDNRYHRTPSDAPRTADKTQLGPRQFQWLVDALTSSGAPFKIVASGGQVLSSFDFFEGYAQYPHEQKRLIDAIIKRKIEGVVFLSGDRHHTELVKVHPDGFYPLYDFTSSPLTSRGAQAEREWNSPSRVPGTLVTSKRNFGLLHFKGPHKDRALILESRDAKGQLLWTHTIRAAELKVEIP